jgi:hypothetical protein
VLYAFTDIGSFKLTSIAPVEHNHQVHEIETRIGTGQLLQSVTELIKQDHNIKIVQILLGQIQVVPVCERDVIGIGVEAIRLLGFYSFRLLF